MLAKVSRAKEENEKKKESRHNYPDDHCLRSLTTLCVRALYLLLCIRLLMCRMLVVAFIAQLYRAAAIHKVDNKEVVTYSYYV